MSAVEYYDQKVETAHRDELTKLQFQKLKEILKKIFGSDSSYKGKFAQSGINNEDIRSINNLRKLPFTVKKDFEKDQEEHPPFGTYLTEPLENYVQYHQTTGTTGKPLKFLDTKESWEWRKKVACHILKAAGVKRGDRVLLPFNFGPYTAFWVMYEGAYHLGNLVIPTGGWNSLQRLQCMIDNQVTVIPTTPTYALNLADAAIENHIDIFNSSVRILMLSGEPGAQIPGIKGKVENLWNAQCTEYIGMTEVGTWGFQCTEEPNGVHILESEFIGEVVNPKTGDPVQEGDVGELVLTNLGRSCMPAIRYRTGDLVKVKKGICRCGRTFQVFEGGVLGRKDDMLVIRGVNVFPNILIEVVESYIQAGDDYRIEAYKKGVVDEIMVKLELNNSENREGIKQSIQNEIRKKLNIRVDIEMVPIGVLPKSNYKTKHFVDRRKEMTL